MTQRRMYGPPVTSVPTKSTRAVWEPTYSHVRVYTDEACTVEVRRIPASELAVRVTRGEYPLPIEGNDEAPVAPAEKTSTRKRHKQRAIRISSRIWAATPYGEAAGPAPLELGFTGERR